MRSVLIHSEFIPGTVAWDDLDRSTGREFNE
jgi:hypothetical protein